METGGPSPPDPITNTNILASALIEYDVEYCLSGTRKYIGFGYVTKPYVQVTRREVKILTKHLDRKLQRSVRAWPVNNLDWTIVKEVVMNLNKSSARIEISDRMPCGITFTYVLALPTFYIILYYVDLIRVTRNVCIHASPPMPYAPLLSVIVLLPSLSACSQM